MESNVSCIISSFGHVLRDNKNASLDHIHIVNKGITLGTVVSLQLYRTETNWEVEKQEMTGEQEH